MSPPGPPSKALTSDLCGRFGLPFVLYMDRAVTWDALQKEILEKMRHLLRPGVYIQVGAGLGPRRRRVRAW